MTQLMIISETGGLLILCLQEINSSFDSASQGPQLTR